MNEHKNILIQIENMLQTILSKLLKLLRLIFSTCKIGYLHTSWDIFEDYIIYLLTDYINSVIYVKDPAQYLALIDTRYLYISSWFLMFSCIMSNNCKVSFCNLKYLNMGNFWGSCYYSMNVSSDILLSSLILNSHVREE